MMKRGDLVTVVAANDFPRSFLQDVEVYTVHPTMTLHGMSEIFEARAGEVGVVVETYVVPSGRVVWVRLVLPRGTGWVDSEHVRPA